MIRYDISGFSAWKLRKHSCSLRGRSYALAKGGSCSQLGMSESEHERTLGRCDFHARPAMRERALW